MCSSDLHGMHPAAGERDPADAARCNSMRFKRDTPAHRMPEQIKRAVHPFQHLTRHLFQTVRAGITFHDLRTRKGGKLRREHRFIADQTGKENEHRLYRKLHNFVFVNFHLYEYFRIC